MRVDDFGADDMAVAITRNPDELRRVLEQLHQDGRTVSVEHGETLAALWFEPLALVDSTTDESGTSWTASLRERIERQPVGG